MEREPLFVRTSYLYCSTGGERIQWSNGKTERKCDVLGLDHRTSIGTSLEHVNEPDRHTLMSPKDEEGTWENDLVRRGRIGTKFDGRAFIGP